MPGKSYQGARELMGGTKRKSNKDVSSEFSHVTASDSSPYGSPALSVDTAIDGHYSVLSVHFGTFFSSTSRDISDIPVEVALPPE